MIGSLFALVAACAACAACARAGEESGPAFERSDSSGVELVLNHRPELAADGAWRVTDSAAVRIGERGGPPEQQLAGVAGALILPGHGFVIADGSSGQLRVFGTDGRYRRSFGRRGKGPGEFTTLAGVGRSGDRVWAYDFALRRVSWIDADDGFTRTAPLAPEPAALAAVGSLPDGSFVLRQLWGVGAAEEAEQTGVRRDPVAVVRADLTGARVDTIAMVPGREVLISVENGRGVMTRRPFGLDLSAAVRGGLVMLGTQDAPAIDAYAPDGSLRRRIRWADHPRAVGRADIERFVESGLEGVDAAARPGRQRALERLSYPDRVPAYDRLIVDLADNLWVRRWQADGDAPATWSVFAPDGRWITEVVLPRRFRLEDASGDLVLGVERDDLDTESVVAYPLRKP